MGRPGCEPPRSLLPSAHPPWTEGEAGDGAPGAWAAVLAPTPSRDRQHHRWPVSTGLDSERRPERRGAGLGVALPAGARDERGGGGGAPVGGAEAGGTVPVQGSSSVARGPAVTCPPPATPPPPPCERVPRPTPHPATPASQEAPSTHLPAGSSSQEATGAGGPICVVACCFSFLQQTSRKGKNINKDRTPGLGASEKPACLFWFKGVPEGEHRSVGTQTPESGK